MKRLVVPLTLLVASRAGAQLRISELLYEPKSHEAEYVEFYNAGESPLSLADYEVVRWVGDSMGRHYALPDCVVEPKGYVVLTKDAASVRANYSVARPERLLECALPTYPNSSGAVVVVRAGDSTVADRFDYRPDMHSPLLRQKGGVALERRSFERDANAEGNWFSASSASGYGTPTAANSQSTELLVLESDFRLSAPIVSPDGDGYEDELEVDYRVDDGTLMGDICLFDAEGREVRHLLNRGLLGTHGTLRWDGRDDGGGRVPRGRYVIHIVVYDSHGKRQTLRKTVAVW